MQSKHHIQILLLSTAILSACTSRDAELANFIEQTKREQPTGVKPLPEVKPYENFAYAAQVVRSPFAPGGSGTSSVAGLRPDSRRNREVLEQFALDTLKMVGTLRQAGRTFGLVQTKDGLIHRVLPGMPHQMVGPFIFFDQMGPAEFVLGQGIDVRPHPHIGLATVTYLFEGEIVHRDSLGSHQAIRPGANEIGFACAGDVLTPYINGVQMRRRQESLHVLHEGQVGISAASFATAPLMILVDWVRVGNP